ncbi:MAG: hypothetical protein ACYTBJ_27490 [Planctomycetota bacterium]|jgi:hypothetical protein
MNGVQILRCSYPIILSNDTGPFVIGEINIAIVSSKPDFNRTEDKNIIDNLIRRGDQSPGCAAIVRELVFGGVELVCSVQDTPPSVDLKIRASP